MIKTRYIIDCDLCKAPFGNGSEVLRFEQIYYGFFSDPNKTGLAPELCFNGAKTIKSNEDNKHLYAHRKCLLSHFEENFISIKKRIKM